MSRILLTTDLSDVSRGAFERTTELAKDLGLPITLLCVVPELRVLPHGAPLAPPLADPDVAEQVEETEARLVEMRDELAASARGVDIDALVLTGPDIVTTIVDYAGKHDVRFIAIATHGRTGIRHLVLGSVAEAVVRHASVPVLCIPVSRVTRLYFCFCSGLCCDRNSIRSRSSRLLRIAVTGGIDETGSVVVSMSARRRANS